MLNKSSWDFLLDVRAADKNFWKVRKNFDIPYFWNIPRLGIVSFFEEIFIILLIGIFKNPYHPCKKGVGSNYVDIIWHSALET